MVYQEQIMQVASTIAGFTMGEADVLRKAINKKDTELLSAMKEQFLEGCVTNGHSRQLARELYDLIERFANYGFNKAHSASYGLLAYQTAYLKAHYPVAFMAALLTSVMGNNDKIAKYIQECRRMNIRVLPPDVNESFATFTIVDEGVRFGLVAVKNMGRAAVRAIIDERKEEGQFTSLQDFLERVEPQKLNRRAVEGLVRAGAFDSLEARRAQLMAVLDSALEAAQAFHRQRDSGQVSFFELAPDEDPFVAAGVELPELPEFPEYELLNMEREVLGIYLSGHPLEHHEQELQRRVSHSVEELKKLSAGTKVTVGGLTTNVQRITTRRGEPMAFLELEDFTGRVEVVVFPGVYSALGGELGEDKVVVAEGKVSWDDEVPKVLADRLQALRRRHTVCLRVVPNAANHRDTLQKLCAVFEEHSGNHPVRLHFAEAGKVLEVDPEYWVKDSPDFRRAVKQVLGANSVQSVGEPS
jgi:DNA polymerase-3 subunit alpha